MNSYYIKEQCWSISLYIIIIVKFIPFGRKCCSPSNSFWRKLSTLQKEAWRLDDLKSVVHSCISLMGFWWFMDKQYHTTMTFNQVWCVRSPFYEPVHDKIIFLPPRGSLPHHTRTRGCTSWAHRTKTSSIWVKSCTTKPMAACQCRNSTQYKVVTFCDRRDGTVSENIYFKFVVNVMREPVRRARAQFQRHTRAQFQRVSWLPYCMNVKNCFL